MNQLIEWILVHSDAPVEIKQLAFEQIYQLNSRNIGKFTVPGDIYSEIEKHDGKIGKIKLLRHFNGCTLRDAKEAVEAEFF